VPKFFSVSQVLAKLLHKQNDAIFWGHSVCLLYKNVCAEEYHSHTDRRTTFVKTARIQLAYTATFIYVCKKHSDI